MSYRIAVFIEDSSASMYYRSMLPIAHCKAALAEQGIEIEATLKPEVESGHDAYIFHRHIAPDIIPTLRAIKRAGKLLIWDLDDNLFAIPSWNPASKAFPPERHGELHLYLDWADIITVTTPYLAQAQALGPYHAKTVVLPNLIDLEEYQTPRRPREPGGPFRFLWAGSDSHAGDLAMITPAIIKMIETYKDQVQFVFMGMIPGALREYPAKNVLFIHGVPLQYYPATLSFLGCDCGLAPLLDDEFNRCKSPIKFLEMVAAGMPVVFSNVQPFHYFVAYSGQYAVDDRDGWFDAMYNAAIKDWDRNKVSSMHLHQRNALYHSWSELKAEWLDFFLSLSTRQPLPISA